jgi:hypothetical protein
MINKLMRSILPFLICLSVIFASSCRRGPKNIDTFIPAFSTYNNDTSGIKPRPGKNAIYYGILTPVEVCEIFNRLNVPYNSAMLNPTSNMDLYMSSSQTSINTGIYGVDLGYLKMFDSGQQMINYMLTIRDMCNKLGIPDYYITDPVKMIQSDISEPDTVMALMQKTYTNIENHLRAEGRESSAGLIVMGGWVEAMFISTRLVYDPADPDPEVVEKIAQQKYTLTSLLSFMKNYYDDPVVVYYTKKLKFLKNYFDTFDIYFKQGDLEIDTTKQILLSSGSELTVTVETLNKIRDYVNTLRTEMVTP